MKSLLIEGWRSSPHSYALVDQHQSLCLAGDARFTLYHSDVPFHRPEWQQLDAGFSTESKALLAGLSTPPHLPVDRIYRVSWPLRAHVGPAERVFVFGTCEYGKFAENSFCGPDGDERGIDFDAVDIITSSRWSRDGFLAAGFNTARVHTISLGINPSMFEIAQAELRQQVRSPLNIPDEAIVFLNIGAMTWNKGIGPLIAAFAQYRMKNEGAFLVLKGGDELYGSLVSASVEEAKRLNPDVNNPVVKSSLRYVSANLTQTKMAALYAASDVYISAYRAEGFNLPVLEALAAGLPVIVTDGGATDDFCQVKYCRKIDAVRVTGAHGYHLEPRIDSIVEHMQGITDALSLYKAAACAGCQIIRDRYSWQSLTRELGDLLDS